jgi:hexosaminidase
LVARQRSTGDLIRYTLSGSGVGSTTVIGHGWGSMRSLIGISDWNGDKRDDLLAVRNDGTLWLYTSSVRGTPNPGVRVGLGWSNFSTVTSPGDISGDGRSDLVAQRKDGVLFAYHLANRRFASPREIGRGLQDYRLIG